MGARNIKSPEDYVKVLIKAQSELGAVEKRVKDVRSSAAALLKALKESPPDSATREQRDAYQGELDHIRKYLEGSFKNDMLEVDMMLEDWDGVLKRGGRL